MDAVRGMQARIAERIAVSHHTLLVVRKGSVTYDAHVSDITRHGFMVRATGTIQRRDLIEIKLPVLGWVAAQVRWSMEDGRVGCKFLDPLEEADFSECLRTIVR